MSAPVILDLCGGTGSWARPYREAGYDVLTIDPASELPDAIRADVRHFHVPRGLPVRGILAAPPCTLFASSGARWWVERDPDGARLAEALEVVSACLRIVAEAAPVWWALENPVGRLHRYIGTARESFQPWEYGDPWHKRTMLWGDFVMPQRYHGTPPEGTDTRIHRAPPGPDRARFRSTTPPQFAAAFALANP